MKKALIVVDMQNDFIDGSLANPDAQAIVEPIAQKVRDFYGDIYLTMDTHEQNYLDTMEGEKLPVKHCIYATEGWCVHQDIMNAAYANESGFVFLIKKHSFGYNDWKHYLEGYDEIEICGTCTDICVVSNALIIKALYPETKITVLKDLCAGLTPEKHEAALEVMRSCQIDVE